ncbi:hypothetical protein Tco_0028893 [Tanacetum coccineum]
MDGYRDPDMVDVIFGEPFCKASCVEVRRFDGLITIHNGSLEVIPSSKEIKFKCLRLLESKLEENKKTQG